MSRRGKAEAIGGLAATLLLLAGLSLAGFSAANADELSDLRASQAALSVNQQQLQQRIDQLAAVQASAGVPQQQAAVLGGPVVAGAPSIAGSFPRSFLIPGTNTSLAISGYVKYDAEEWFQGGNPAVGSGGSDIYGLASLAGAPLNLKGPAGSITAAPTFNPAKRQYWQFHNTSAEARIRIETRTPTDIGQVTTVLELDNQGCTTDTAICSNLDNGTFAELTRLRLAYATVGGFLAGQAFIPVNDNAAHPDIFDFSGDAGYFGFSRAPWIGYTWQLPYGTSFQVAAVTPSSELATPIGGLENACNPATPVTPSPGISNCPGATAGVNGGLATGWGINPLRTTMPDGNFVIRAEQPWGHVQGGFVLERETLNDGRFLHQNLIGFGGGVSGNWRPNWFGFSSKDNFGFNSFAGEGLGHYGNPSGGGEPGTSNGLQSNFGLVGRACNQSTGVGCYGNAAAGTTGNTVTNAALVSTSTIPQRGIEFNYQHWWLANLRSTVSIGWQNNEYNLNLLGRNQATLNYNRYLTTNHVNIIWSPVSFIDTGFESFFGRRQTVLQQRGQIWVLDYSFRVKF